MKIYIKNMVCNRCKTAVRSEFEKLGLYPISIELGEVELKEKEINSVKQIFIRNLRDLGFDWLDDKDFILVEKIKNLIIELVHYNKDKLRINISDYLSQKLCKEYHSLSSLFSQHESLTIEKYYILQKIEKVKELLTYNNLNLNEIAFQLNYSSSAHLSNQFKKITHQTPSQFKKQKINDRLQIDKVLNV